MRGDLRILTKSGKNLEFEKTGNCMYLGELIDNKSSVEVIIIIGIAKDDNCTEQEKTNQNIFFIKQKP